MLEGLDKAVPWLISVATGRAKIEGTDDLGRKFKRAPTAKERIEAFDKLAKYGLGTKQEISGEDGGPIRVDQREDLSHLSREELETIHGILRSKPPSGQS